MFEKCQICGKEMIPKITVVDENNIEMNLTTGSFRGGLGNKEIAKCCEECLKMISNGFKLLTKEGENNNE